MNSQYAIPYLPTYVYMHVFAAVTEVKTATKTSKHDTISNVEKYMYKKKTNTKMKTTATSINLSVIQFVFDGWVGCLYMCTENINNNKNTTKPSLTTTPTRNTKFTRVSL